ncbi:hypothetical protein [Microlunatus soli]|nr:hypothetical protein [Microlunatus soli]
MNSNSRFHETGTAGSDPYFGRLLAGRSVADLHSEGAARRLINEQRRLRPRADLRSVVAAGLRRVADRLAPDIRQAPSAVPVGRQFCS